MEDVKWLEVAVNTTPERLDEVTAKLTAAGMASVVIEDEGDFKQFLEQNRQYWDYVDQELLDRMAGVCRVKFYVTDDGHGREQLARYTQGLDCEYTTAPLSENDWAYSWQKYYKPLTIGERLYEAKVYLQTADLFAWTLVIVTLSVGFEKVYLLQNNLNRPTSEVISTYVYQLGILGGQQSQAAAIGLFNTVVSLALVLTVNKISDRMTGNALM